MAQSGDTGWSNHKYNSNGTGGTASVTQLDPKQIMLHKKEERVSLPYGPKLVDKRLLMGLRPDAYPDSNVHIPRVPRQGSYPQISRLNRFLLNVRKVLDFWNNVYFVVQTQTGTVSYSFTNTSSPKMSRMVHMPLDLAIVKLILRLFGWNQTFLLSIFEPHFS